LLVSITAITPGAGRELFSLLKLFFAGEAITLLVSTIPPDVACLLA
jgi:hypothetical protein